MISLYFIAFISVLLPYAVCFVHKPSSVRLSRAVRSVREEVQVGLGPRSYPILVRRQLLEEEATRAAIAALSASRALVVTNDRVGPLYLDKVRSLLGGAGLGDVREVVVPDGEQHKSWDSLGVVLEAALQARLDRKSVFVALGGGVIGDLCGMAASVYMRGVRCVQVPTSLMAMVDSSVGGKTAVNHPLGKNLLGTFHQPSLVLTDTATLGTLPRREFLSGLAEVVKYGLIADRDLFAWLQSNAPSLAAQPSDEELVHIIRRSCEIKAKIVKEDEREEGTARASLNFGHTFGHAIESLFGYGHWLHGEALSIGMMMATELSRRCGMINDETVQRTQSLLQSLQLPIDFGGVPSGTVSITTAQFIDSMMRDKKTEAGKLKLLLLRGIGDVVYTNDFNADILHDVVSDFLRSLN